MVLRSALRWYKNRVVLDYDTDSKNLNASLKVDGYTGADQDGRRMMLTMVSTAASRLLLANSARDLDDSAVRDLERVLPFSTKGRSARPVDAFVTGGWPRVYDLPIDPAWHAVTLLNNTLPTRPETITVPLAGEAVDGPLGLDPAADYYVYDFWNDRFAGRIKAGQPLVETLRPGEARVLSVHKVENHPQFLSTNRHLLQGYLDLTAYPAWDAATQILRGTSAVVGGETYRLVLALNGKRVSGCVADGAVAAVKPVNGEPGLAVLELTSPANAGATWEVRFQ